MPLEKRIAVVFYRTLSSQSAVSISGTMLAAHLRKLSDVSVDIVLLGDNKEDKQLDKGWDYVFYKPNFKDVDKSDHNIAKIKSTNPDCKVILFGPHPFLNAKKMITPSCVYGIMRPNLEYLVADIIDRNDNTSLINEGNIDDCYSKYDVDEGKLFSVKAVRDIEKKEPIFIANIEASRGCQMGCSFCHVGTITRLTKTRPLTRKVSDVMDEIGDLIKLDKRYIIFNDAVLGGTLLNLDWVLELCNAIQDLNTKPYFMAYMTLKQIKKVEVVESLSRANFIRIFVGIESATANSLKHFNKNVVTPEFLNLKKTLLSKFIVPHIGFMLFHPFTQKDEIMKNLEFLYSCDELHRFGVIVEKTRIFPQTDLYEKTKAAGLLVDNNANYDFSSKEVRSVYKKLMSFFEGVGLPVFERAEYLFTTAEFINNIVKKDFYPNEDFNASFQTIVCMKEEYSKAFLKLCESIINNKEISQFDFLHFRGRLEKAWAQLIANSEKAGLEQPLEWLANGSLNPESRDKNAQDFIETRTGVIGKCS